MLVPVAGSISEPSNASGVSLGPPIGSPTGTEIGSGSIAVGRQIHVVVHELTEAVGESDSDC